MAEQPDNGDDAADAVDLAAYLAGLDHAALVGLLLERAANDAAFDARLRASATAATGAQPNLGAFRTALATAFETGGYIDYRDAHDYATRIGSVLDELQLLLDDGHPEHVMALSEYAVDLAETAVGHIDDSDGWMTQVAEQLQDLHLAACTEARPEQRALAARLYQRELAGGDLEVFYGAVETYAEVLGDAGLAEYRRLAQADWDALPSLGPGDSEHSWSSHRFSLTRIMLSLAKLSGDVDAVVEVLARDLSSAYDFVQIAETLHGAARYDEALDWALRGLSCHGYRDHGLAEFVAAAYHRDGRSEEAADVMRHAYEESPSVQSYRRLAAHAKRAGRWPAYRDDALAYLRQHTMRDPDHSLLVAVLLADGDVDQAWSAATTGGCLREQWLELARLRENDHPDDAIPLWRAEVTRAIAAMNNSSYADAVALIERIGRLMTAAGREDEFSPYVAALATEHRRKRNLMRLFAQRGW
ncbi:MAG: hypothetical protein QM662_01500 [Gordonia sp. (in: high G+C Gram-positive bacteria)]